MSKPQTNSQWFTTRPRPPLSQHTASTGPATAGKAITVFFSHRSSLILGSLIVAFAIGKIALGGWQWLDLVAAVAIFAFWPLLEWFIHVALLHNKPRRLFGRDMDFLLPQTHRWHHADPWNLQWVFIPPHIFPLVAPLLIAAVFWIFPAPLACSILLCYFALALHYEWVHYLAHINWCPPLKYYQRRVREHRLHHFKNEKLWWGVSMGLGDRLLGTAPQPGSTPKSPTTNNILGMPL